MHVVDVRYSLVELNFPVFIICFRYGRNIWIWIKKLSQRKRSRFRYPLRLLFHFTNFARKKQYMIGKSYALMTGYIIRNYLIRLIVVLFKLRDAISWWKIIREYSYTSYRSQCTSDGNVHKFTSDVNTRQKALVFQQLMEKSRKPNLDSTNLSSILENSKEIGGFSMW